jgi:hypothetical protein
MPADGAPPTDPADAARPRAGARRRLVAALLFLSALAVYSSTGPAFLNADAVPARYLPFSLLREADFDLDEFPFLYDEAASKAYASPEGHPYFITKHRGHYVSRYSPWSGILATPAYALPVMAGLSATSPRVWMAERLGAATLIALSAVFLFLALCERTSQRFALLIAVLYAFGTGCFSMTSQILWEQTSTQFLLAAALLCVVRSERHSGYLWGAGAALAAVTVVRPPDLLLTAPLGLYLLVRHRMQFLRVVAGGVVPVIVAVAYNYRNLGGFAGSDRASATFAAYVWSIPYFEGLHGVLWSASRGLFVFSPFLLFALPGIVIAWRRGPTLLRCASVGPLLFASLYSKYIFWDGGWGYGPRYLLDIVSTLCLFLPPVLDWTWHRPWVRAAFLSLGLVSVGVNALGAYLYDPTWEGQAPTMQENYARIKDWRSSQILHHASIAAKRLGPLRRLVVGKTPTSASAPDLLNARYEVDAQSRTVQAGGALDVPVRAVNTGEAVWLDKPERYYGAVRLAWTWHQDGRPVDATVWREDLEADVPPGGSHAFRGRIPAPQTPGLYRLRIGLVSELVVHFHDTGVPQIEIDVHVTSP